MLNCWRVNEPWTVDITEFLIQKLSCVCHGVCSNLEAMSVIIWIPWIFKIDSFKIPKNSWILGNFKIRKIRILNLWQESWTIHTTTAPVWLPRCAALRMAITLQRRRINTVGLPLLNGNNVEIDEPRQRVLIHRVDVWQVGDREEENARVLSNGTISLTRLLDLFLRLLSNLSSPQQQVSVTQCPKHGKHRAVKPRTTKPILRIIFRDSRVSCYQCTTETSNKHPMSSVVTNSGTSVRRSEGWRDAPQGNQEPSVVKDTGQTVRGLTRDSPR